MSIFDKLFGKRNVEATPTAPQLPHERVPKRSQGAMKELEALRRKELGKAVIDERPPESAARIARVSEKMNALEQGRYDSVREFLGDELLHFARQNTRSSAQDLRVLRQELESVPGGLHERLRTLDAEIAVLREQPAGGSTDAMHAHITQLQKREDQASNVRRLLDAWRGVQNQFDAIDALPAEKE